MYVCVCVNVCYVCVCVCECVLCMCVCMCVCAVFVCEIYCTCNFKGFSGTRFVVNEFMMGYLDLLFAEEDSHKCKDLHTSITKACIYANFHLGYLATHNVRSPGYCIHFPSAHSSAKECKRFAAIIRCTWSYDDFCFLYSAEPLALNTLNTLEQSITTLIDELIALQFHDRDMASLYHLFKLDLNQVNNTPLFRDSGWTCNSQCLSGNSLVLKVAKTDSAGTQTQKVFKFVNPLVFLNLYETKQHSSNCTHLHFEAFLVGPISKHCLSPLTEVEAEQCLQWLLVLSCLLGILFH